MFTSEKAIQLRNQKRFAFLKDARLCDVAGWLGEGARVLPLIEVHTGLDILLDTLQGAHTDGLATLFDR